MDDGTALRAAVVREYPMRYHLLSPAAWPVSVAGELPSPTLPGRHPRVRCPEDAEGHDTIPAVASSGRLRTQEEHGASVLLFCTFVKYIIITILYLPISESFWWDHCGQRCPGMGGYGGGIGAHARAAFDRGQKSTAPERCTHFVPDGPKDGGSHTKGAFSVGTGSADAAPGRHPNLK